MSTPVEKILSECAVNWHMTKEHAQLCQLNRMMYSKELGTGQAGTETITQMRSKCTKIRGTIQTQFSDYRDIADIVYTRTPNSASFSELRESILLWNFRVIVTENIAVYFTNIHVSA